MSTIVVAVVGRRGDVEEHQLVGALGVVAGGQLDRIAGVAQVDEVDALDDAAAGDVEARDHPGDLHHRPPRSAAQRLGHREPPFVQRLAGDDAAEARDRRRAPRRRRATTTPPLAITGTSVAAAAAASPSTSGPASMPSRPMSVMTNAAAVGNRPSASSSCTPLALGPAVHRELAVAVVEPDGDRRRRADAASTSVGVAHGGRAHHHPVRRRRRRAPRHRRRVRTPPPVCTCARPCDARRRSRRPRRG